MSEREETPELEPAARWHGFAALRCGRRRQLSFTSTPCLSSTTAAHHASPSLLYPAGLPNAVAWWGWIGGPVLLFLFYVVSLWTSQMLAAVYRVGDTEYGRFYRAVFGILVSCTQQG